MATRTNKVEVEIVAVDEASPKIDKLTKKIDGLESDEARIVITAEIEKLDAQLSEALGKVHQLDGDELTVNARLIGSLEDDMIAAAKLFEQLDGKTGTVKLDADVSDYTTKAQGAVKSTDDLSHSARGANSALANMIGNSAQDLGELGGVVGSLGVGIGQMGEYAADAKLSGEALGSALGSMAMVAGPILGISLAIEGLSWWMNRGKEEAKEIAEATDQFADALFRAQDEATSLSDAISEVTSERADEWLRGLADQTDAVGDSMDDLGITFADIRQAMRDGTGPAADVIRQYRDLESGATREKGSLTTLYGEIVRLGAQRGLNADQALAEYQAIKTLNDAVGDEVELSNTSIANAERQAEIRGEVADATNAEAEATRKATTERNAYIDAWERAGDQAADEAAVTAAVEQHTNAIARLNVEAERVDRARIAHEEENAVQRVRDKYRALRDDLSDKRSLLDLKDQFDRLEQAAAEAWEAGVTGAENAEEAQRNYQREQINTTQDVLDYATEVLKLPDEVVTRIQALIDQGKYAEAERALDALSAPKSVEFIAHLNEVELQRQLAAFYARNGGGQPGVIGGGPRSVNPDGGGGPMVVNVNLPRGSRGIDVVRQVTGQARRSGRRYGAPVVSYARR